MYAHKSGGAGRRRQNVTDGIGNFRSLHIHTKHPDHITDHHDDNTLSFVSAADCFFFLPLIFMTTLRHHNSKKRHRRRRIVVVFYFGGLLCAHCCYYFKAVDAALVVGKRSGRPTQQLMSLSAPTSTTTAPVHLSDNKSKNNRIQQPAANISRSC
jgi:hypothetical protein